MHLKRLDIQGFKTFASKTSFVFQPGITAVVGPNGSGKCVIGDSLVTLADGREVPIRDLVDRALASAPTVDLLDDGWVTTANSERIQVLSLNPKTFKLEPRFVTGFVKREAPGYLLRIQTRAGRRITATPYHPLFTLDNGQLRALRADEIQSGTRIALARKLPVASNPVSLDPCLIATMFAALRDLPTIDNPNQDLVPGVTPLVRTATKLAQVALKRHRAGHATLMAYVEQRCEASRAGLLEVADQIEALGQTSHHAQEMLTHLRTLAQSDVYWDEVVAVEQVVPPDPWVYDLSIAETHNFVAEHIIVHNSNLADAVRWVLGEQSLTTLRCKRSEELIYAGGGRRAPAGFAEVSLTIDNSDRLLPLDFDEVTITRRATRAGDSEYFINRAKVRLRDLLEATEPLGGAYTIINQGLVDAALTLRPDERRRLFEDAAEIGGFELRKAEAIRRLRETETNLSRLSDLLAELEPRLRTLKRQAAQARQHHELSAELRQLHTQHYAALWHAAQTLVATTTALRTQTEQALEQARSAQSQAAEQLQRLRAEVRIRREEVGQWHQAASSLHREAEAAQRRLAVSDERTAALTRQATSLERQQHDLALRRHEAEAAHAAANAAVEQATSALAQQRQAFAEAEAARVGEEQARLALANDVRQAQDAALRATRTSAAERSRYEQQVVQAERFANELVELTAHLEQAATRVATVQQEQAHAQSQISAAEAQRAQAATRDQQTRHALETLRSQRAQLDEQRAHARRTLTDVEARLDSLSRLARSYTGTFAGVRAAMQWAERTGRSGFALVQALIRTPPALETAIEVALGSRLQQIVVNQWADAEAAIAELKRSGAGRATFLPLDTLRPPRDEARPTYDPERIHERLDEPVLGVAADLVAYDPPYAPVVRQLLGRVLLVRDLPTARTELRSLGTGWTIVTLGGEQLNSGGAVTGGAQTKESGALRRERELRELPVQVAAARNTVEQIEQERTHLEAQAQTLAAQQREHEAALRESQRLLERSRAALEAAERRSAQATQEHQWLAQRETALHTQQAELAHAQAETHQRLVAAEAQVHAAETALAAVRARQEAQAQADQAAQQQLATLRSAVSTAEGLLRTERSMLDTRTQNLALLTRQADELVRAVEHLHTERTALAEEQRAAEALSTQHLTELAALRAKIEPAEATLHADEQRLGAAEATDASGTRAMLDAEAAQSRAALEAQRAHDRQEALFERAAADGIDLISLTTPTASDTNASASSSDDPQTRQAAIEALKTKILRLGAVNPLALEEYDATAERQSFLTGQLDDLRTASATLIELIGELDEAMQRRFAVTFRAVAEQFSLTFQHLFGGGSAHLMLSGAHNADDGNDSTSAKVQGVEIIARPPGKKQQNIALLSGGERTLTAVALLFAILRVNPSPFCILDETDAALDESNVGRFREALGALTEQTQFVVITHNRGTIEAADTLYGVTMGDDGASRTMSLRVDAYVSERGV